MSDIIRFGARLKAARRAAGYPTAKSFTRKYKIPLTTYCQHEKGSRNPEEEALQNYSKYLEVRYEWLKTGEGLPFSKMNKKQKTIMQEELLDITSMRKPTGAVEITHQELLVKILEELFKFNEKQKHKLNINKIVKDSVALYTDILATDQNFDAQLKILTPMLNAYKRFSDQN